MFLHTVVASIRSYCRCVNSVVLSMRSDEADVGDLPVVVHRNHEPIVVTFDIENYAIIGHKTGVAIRSFNVRWRAPNATGRNGVPRRQWLSRIGMPSPKITECSKSNDAHEGNLPRSQYGSNDLKIKFACCASLKRATVMHQQGCTRCLCLQRPIMPLISSTNIATGFHAGDSNTMQRMVGLAAQNNVGVGAHTGVRNTVGVSINGFRQDLVGQST